jgi:hypothetical protein
MKKEACEREPEDRAQARGGCLRVVIRQMAGK